MQIKMKESIQLVGIYVRTHNKEELLTSSLQRIRGNDDLRTIYVRDFNASHVLWDEKTNGRGKALAR